MLTESVEIANTWKFRTVVFVILACILPLWPISIPLFLYLAYRSYIAGRPVDATEAPGASGVPQHVAEPYLSNKARGIAELHELYSSGALTQDEFDAEKKKLLAAQ